MNKYTDKNSFKPVYSDKFITDEKPFENLTEIRGIKPEEKINNFTEKQKDIYNNIKPTIEVIPDRIIPEDTNIQILDLIFKK